MSNNKQNKKKEKKKKHTKIGFYVSKQNILSQLGLPLWHCSSRFVYTENN